MASLYVKRLRLKVVREHMLARNCAGSQESFDTTRYEKRRQKNNKQSQKLHRHLSDLLY